MARRNGSFLLVFCADGILYGFAEVFVLGLEPGDEEAFGGEAVGYAVEVADVAIDTIELYQERTRCADGSPGEVGAEAERFEASLGEEEAEDDEVDVLEEFYDSPAKGAREAELFVANLYGGSQARPKVGHYKDADEEHYPTKRVEHTDEFCAEEGGYACAAYAYHG